MAQYQIVDNTTGRKITLEADSPPTDEESLELFAQYGGGEQKAPAIQTAPEIAAPQPGIIQQTFDQYSKPLPDNKMFSKKYLEENVVPSAARIVPQALTGMVAIPYNAAKKFTDPIYNALSGKQELGAAASDLWNAPKNAAGEFVNGLAQTVGAPIGLGANKGDMNRAWNDPAAATLAVAPIAGVAGKGIAAGMPTNVAQGLTQKALKFSPGIEPELQQRVANTVLKNDASTTPKSYAKFKQTIKDLNESVKDMITPVAETKIEVTPDSWVQGLLEKVQTSGEKSKDLSEITTFLEEFKVDHPELTVGEAQKVKVSLNKKLEAFEKARQAGKSTENAAREDAMRAVANGLRGEIEKYAPETKEANAQIHEMLIAKPFLKTATNKAENQPTFSGRDMISGGVAGMMTTNPAIGTGVMIGSRLLRDPRVQSKTAVALDSLSDFKAKIGKMFKPGEVTKIVEEVEPELQKLLPAPERGFEMRNPEDVYSPLGPKTQIPQGLSGQLNQLALPYDKNNQLALPPGGPPPEMVPPVVNSFERLFQIAQSPEGMRLLKEKLGREEKYTKLLEELSGAGLKNAIEYKPDTSVNQTQVWRKGDAGWNRDQVQQYQIQPSGFVQQVPPTTAQKIYHVTKSGNLPNILEKGLTPTQKSDIHAALELSSAKKWANVKGDVILRFRPTMSTIEGTYPGQTVKHTKAVRPEDIEIQVGNSWKPLIGNQNALGQ